MKIIEVKKLTKLYENKRGIKNLSFTLDEGNILCIIGNNGAGKTTALKCIMNLLIPDQGEILINGNSVLMDSKKYKRSISYIPELPIYYNELTVYDHLKFIAMAYELDYKEFENKVKFYASKYEVENYLHCYFNELSKVCFASKKYTM
ncbi:ATP-binding cassette domain-containing protein [Sedimentibacter sp. zth1]|uniref:ATP-binding cassette domain-containing protein n=1 Tax=Sedimentibacter sp. zth1 TaxID=2816908 RepID=UPI001A91F807|nr:ATP-binding cassette domain-containing protein [Sedimentibacter sp. zth1]QSX05888.1 ATP-binding cassette domain-containing protein [Sedimentibacter sp. zth1]